MFTFGSGFLFGVPVGGNQAPNPTPVQFGTLQEVSLDISADIKELYGQNQFADDIAVGKRKVTGKAKLGRINGILLNQLLFGATSTVGSVKYARDEAGTIPASTPWTVTATNSATFGEDLGVKYAATGVSLTKVASGPTTGQYSVAAGVYTFAAADTGLGVRMSYSYDPASQTTGTTVPVSNQPMGYSPIVEVHLYNNYEASQYGLRLYSCRFTKLSLATKQEDFLIPELDFSASANAAGNVFDLLLSE